MASSHSHSNPVVLSATTLATTASVSFIDSVRQLVEVLSKPVVIESVLRHMGAMPQDQAVQLSSGLCIFFESQGELVSLLERLAQREFDTGTEENTYLREETPATLLISGFLSAYGAPLLPHFLKKALAPLEKSVRKASTLATPVGQVWLFRRIVDAVAQTPQEMVLPVLRLLLVLANARNPDIDTVATSFVDIVRRIYILRFICPYLVLRGLSLSLRGVDRPAMEQIRKGYLVCVKMLQCLAASTELGSQVDNREALNAAIMSSYEKYDTAINMTYLVVANFPPSTRLSTPMKSINGTRLSLNTKEQMELAHQSFQYIVELNESETLTSAAQAMVTFSARRLAVELA